MPTGSLGDPAVEQSVAQVAAGFRGRAGLVARELRELLESEVPELRDETRLLELVRASIDDNVRSAIQILEHDTDLEAVVPPPASRALARLFAQRGTPVTIQLRNYRLGLALYLEHIYREVQQTPLDSAGQLHVYQRFVALLSAYVDRMAQQVTDQYEAERVRWSTGETRLSPTLVRELLAGKATEDHIAAATGYRLGGANLAAILATDRQCAESDALDQLEGAARSLAELFSPGVDPLVVVDDAHTAWVWFSMGERAHPVELTPELVGRARKTLAHMTENPAVALGQPEPGVSGFRHSHRQAVLARELASLAGERAPGLVAYGEPGTAIAAILSRDLSVTRPWVRDVLGGLAVDDDNAARLRDTLRVFLAAGSSNKAAADALNLHYNSVKYRVRKAISSRGRPIVEDRLDVELALLLCHRLGPAVLCDGRSDPS